MPLRTCPDCESIVSTMAAACPKCGRAIASVAISEPPCKKCGGLFFHKGTQGHQLVPAVLLVGAFLAVVFRAVDVVPVAMVSVAVLVARLGPRTPVLYCPTCKAWK